MVWKYLLCAWLLPKPVPLGTHQPLTIKEKWVLKDAIQLSDTHLLQILDRKNNQGYDNRTIENKKEVSLEVFEEFYQKQLLLNFLQDESISFIHRSNYASEYLEDNFPPNPIMSGGLLDDWEWDF
jgi:hypothetical protein